MGALKWGCCASESCRSYLTLPELHSSNRRHDRSPPHKIPFFALWGNPFGPAPGPQSRAGRTDSAFASSPGGNNWLGNKGRSNGFAEYFCICYEVEPQPFFRIFLNYGRNHSFSLSTGTNFFQQQSYKTLPFYLQFPHHNCKEHSRSFLLCCDIRGNNFGHARKSKWQESCCKVLGKCALGRQVIDATWQNINTNIKSLRFMVLYSKHLTEEVLDAQPLTPVLALLQGVLHRCRMVFKVIKAQRNSGSLDSSSHRTEISIVLPIP